jgi:hypothetical protein
LKKLSRALVALSLLVGLTATGGVTAVATTQVEQAPVVITATNAAKAVAKLVVKGRAPQTGYDRDLFSDGWGKIGSCDARNYVLARDLRKIVWRAGETCIVESGVLNDPYTGKTINFLRGRSTSIKVQIDHVVAISDAWQKGAQKWSYAKRYNFYNDPLNLLAVDGPTNGSKGDGDTATWLPPNKAYRCAYVARQVAVKLKYSVWVTAAEKSAMGTVLAKCPTTSLPTK